MTKDTAQQITKKANELTAYVGDFIKPEARGAVQKIFINYLSNPEVASGIDILLSIPPAELLTHLNMPNQYRANTLDRSHAL